MEACFIQYDHTMHSQSRPGVSPAVISKLKSYILWCMQEEHLPNTLRQVGISLTVFLTPTCLYPKLSRQAKLALIMPKEYAS